MNERMPCPTCGWFKDVDKPCRNCDRHAPFKRRKNNRGTDHTARNLAYPGHRPEVA